MPVCYRKGCERGKWFELVCIRKRIAGLEYRGEDASFECELYESWITYPNYTEADKENQREGRYGDWALVGNQRERALKTG